MSEPNPVSEVVKEETAKQTVILIFSIIGVIVAGIMIREIDKPDQYKTFKMASALKLKRMARRQQEWWERVGDKAATVYNNEKL